MLSGKGVLKIRSKCTGEHPCQSAISIKLLCNLIEIALRHGCSSVDLLLLHIFRTPFLKNTSGRLLPELGKGDKDIRLELKKQNEKGINYLENA